MMDDHIRQAIADIHSTDSAVRNQAYTAAMAATDTPVDWAYTVWDGVVADFRHEDNHVRAIAAQLLCNLAKSDPEQRILKDYPALLNVTKDDRFVTARHCMQSLWKVGVAGPAQRKVYLDGMVQRYNECITEKNGTLIRSDILQSMRSVYDVTGDDSIKTTALALIESEADLKYRKKYAGLWKKT